MTTWVDVANVEFGAFRAVWCAGCQTSARSEAELYGLVETGLVTLGVWSRCDYCDRGDGDWRCAFCPTVLPMSATAAWAHLREAHSESATDQR